jgi:MFS family permease
MAVIAVQSLGNTMSTSFWLVYLVSPPNNLSFEVAVLVWLLPFAIAAVAVPLYASGRAVRATPSMSVGLLAVIGGHLSFAFLPPAYAILGGALGFGIYIPTFWLPLNLLLSKETSPKNRAGRMAGITATFTIVSVVAPAIGGFLAQAFTYSTLFVLSAGVIAANLLLVRSLQQREETHVFRFDLRRTGPRACLAFSGQGAVEGLTTAATPLASFLFTTAAAELGLLFAFFSLAAGVTTYVLGRVSDRVRRRTPFLLVGPLLSVPASLAAALLVGRDFGGFAMTVGLFSVTSSLAPPIIMTIALDRMEDALPQVVATREILLNVSRTISLVGALAALAAGLGVAFLFLLVGGVVLLEALAK